MTKELEQAADEWVEKYAFRVPYDGSNEFYDKEADKHGRAGFIAGATSPEAKAYWEQQGWVSVEERLPDVGKKLGESDYILCLTEFSEQVVCWYNRNNEWIVANYKADSLPLVPQITHWQPLPSPPKTDKQ